jgi:hypothetical protein
MLGFCMRGEVIISFLIILNVLFFVFAFRKDLLPYALSIIALYFIITRGYKNASVSSIVNIVINDPEPVKSIREHFKDR